MEGKEQHLSREERHVQRPCGKEHYTFKDYREQRVQNGTGKGDSGRTVQILAVPQRI